MLLDEALLSKLASDETGEPQASLLQGKLRGETRNMARLFAREVRRGWPVGDGPVPVELIARAGGAEIAYRDQSPYDGLTTRECDGNLIIVSTAMSRYRRRFTIAHEIGHLILNEVARYLFGDADEPPNVFRTERTSGRRTAELFCDWFAAGLLIPEQDLEPFSTWQGISIRQLARCAMARGVSLAAVTWHVLQCAPYKGGAFKFLTRAPWQPGRRQPGSGDPDLLLAEALFPKHYRLHVPIGMRVPAPSELHAIIARAVADHRAGGVVPDRLYREIDVAIGPIAGRWSVLVKPFEQTTWVLLIPKEVAEADLPADCARMASLRQPAQLALL